MNIRETVLKHLAAVVTERSPLPFPTNVSDEMFLDDFWLDSISFTSLLTGIEAELGFIPSDILTGASFPRTIGELVGLYEYEAHETVNQ